MILKSVRIHEYKNIRDSGDVEIDGRVTCLVGKNESGKSSLLEAIYRLNPAATGHPETFSALRDYPRRRYVQDRDHVPATCPVTAVFELEEEDLRAVEEATGTQCPTSRRIVVSRNYGNDLMWHFERDAAPGRSGVRSAGPRGRRRRCRHRLPRGAFRSPPPR